MKKFLRGHKWVRTVVVFLTVLIILLLAAMPIHWGAFALANHPWDDSAERFVAAGEQAGLQVVTPRIGETMSLGSMEDCMERWWRAGGGNADIDGASVFLSNVYQIKL